MAAKTNVVSFDRLVEQHFYSQPKFNPDKESRLRYTQDPASLQGDFERTHGPIKRSYYCKNVIAAVVLTETNEIHAILNEDVPGATEVATELNWLDQESERLLSKRQRAISADFIYGAYSALLFYVDLPAGSSDATRLAQALTTAQLWFTKANNHFMQSAQREAQVVYFRGMKWGLLGLLSLLFIMWAVNLLVDDNMAIRLLLFSLISGAFGAAVSVMSRMSSGKLRLDLTADLRQLLELGIVRPVIGAVFGAVSYLLLAGGLLPIQKPNDPAALTYFYCGIAFIAGFSERWAQDMLIVAQPTFTRNQESSHDTRTWAVQMGKGGSSAGRAQRNGTDANKQAKPPSN